MGRPVIAVVGSANTDREYRKPLRNLEQAHEASRELGRELATAGWDLLVFSEDDGYVEPWVVEGYRSSPGATDGTIRVRQPIDHSRNWPTDPDGPRVIREPVPASLGWEIPFYGAILEVDALLLIGGARATRTAGIIALNRRIPILPLPTFGGAAEQIWEELTKIENDTDRDLRSAMTVQQAPDTAQKLVAILDEQRRRQIRRARAERRAATSDKSQTAVRHLAGLGLTVAAAAAGSYYYGWRLAGVIVIAMVVGAGGALVSREEPGRSDRQGRRGIGQGSFAVAAARGAFAGFVTVLTYVVSQTLGAGTGQDLANGAITVFALISGAIAGFTADRVLARIRPVDPSDPSGIVRPRKDLETVRDD